jgi:hypothetical protein
MAYDSMQVTKLRTFGRNSLQPQSSFSQVMAQICVITMICVSITVPAFSLSQDLPYLKVEQVLLPMILLIYVLMLLAGRARLIRFNGMFVVGAVYSLCVLLSTWYGADILHRSVIPRDFYEIPKAWLPVVFFTLAYEAELSESSLLRLLNFFALAILFVCFYAWGQYGNLSIANALNPYYSAGEHVDRALQYTSRVYSTMGNPNVLGQLMSWSIVAFAMAALFRVGNRAWNAFVAFSCLVTLVMTASRYGLLTASCGIAMMLAFPSHSGRRRAALLGFLLLALPIAAWTIKTVATANPYATERLQSLRNPVQTNSVRERLDSLWPEAISDFQRSPLLGHGPAKIYFSGIYWDTEYLLVLKRFGIIGFLGYIAYYIFPLFIIWKGLQAGQRAGPHLEERLPATFLALRVSFVMIVLALLMNMGESTFYHALLPGFLWMWIGIGARSARTLIDASGRLHSPAQALIFARAAGVPFPLARFSRHQS